MVTLSLMRVGRGQFRVSFVDLPRHEFIESQFETQGVSLISLFDCLMEDT